MAPLPYSERVPEPFDCKNLNEELPDHQRQGDTPSPRTPSTSSSQSPPPVPEFAAASNALVPLLTEDGIPYDHTLPQFIRQVSGEPALDEVQNMSLRVFTEAASLQQMSLYTPNLQELNLSGSSLSSLRDIGSELRFLHVLRVSRCRLRNLDGTMGLSSLRELHADSNMIASAAPCAHLPHLKILDLSRNLIVDKRTLGFLSSCRHIENVRVAGNMVVADPDLQTYLRSIIPTLRFLNDFRIGETSTGTAPTLIEVRPVTAPVMREESLPVESRSRRGSVAGVLTPIEVTDENPGPGPSSISRLTSGQVLCGNIGALRRRRQSLETAERQDEKLLQKEEEEQKDPLEGARRWRAAYYKFRELNGARWEKESQKAGSSASRTETNQNDDEKLESNQIEDEEKEIEDEESSPYPK